MVDEERLAAFEHREVRRLFELCGQVAEELMEERPQQVPPVPPRQPPGRRPEDVVVAAFRVGQKAALAEGIRQSEHAAAIDANELGELFQRDRFG
jgi:hypothetical protein